MKNSILKLLIIVFTIILSASCKDKVAQNTQETGYTISGTIKGLNQGSVKITDTGNREKVTVIDSAQIVNGAFKFTGKVDFPDMVNLVIDGKSSRFFLENSPISITIDWSDVKPTDWQLPATVSGSKTHDEFTKIDAKSKAVFKDSKYKPLDTLRVMFSKAKKSNNQKDMDAALAVKKN